MKENTMNLNSIKAAEAVLAARVSAAAAAILVKVDINISKIIKRSHSQHFYEGLNIFKQNLSRN